jgi:hypothetical protein
MKSNGSTKDTKSTKGAGRHFSVKGEFAIPMFGFSSVSFVFFADHSGFSI